MTRRPLLRGGLAVASLLIGLLVLWLRPSGSWLAVAMVAAVGVLGLAAPVPARPTPAAGAAGWIVATAIGTGAFVLARALTTLIPTSFSPLAVMANVVAAVGEEAFFRRLMYGWLETWGVATAAAVSACAFAVIHLPAYGATALPVDLAAGLLFGWQRWAAGTWTAPAATHVAANLLQMG